MATVIIAAALWILPLMTAGTLPPLPDKPRVVIESAGASTSAAATVRTARAIRNSNPARPDLHAAS